MNSHTCVQCTAASHSACTGATPYCETDASEHHDTCVACIGYAQGCIGGCNLCFDNTCHDSSEPCEGVTTPMSVPGCYTTGAGCQNGCCVGNYPAPSCSEPLVRCEDAVGDGGVHACALEHQCDANDCCLPYTPIIIDIEGDGYSLTSPANGVLFDMAGTGQRSRVSWTSAGSDEAFLALDRNGNGTIDNGSELFGNFSPNSGPGERNGYTALAVYDKPANGGNGDGWIDSHDAIYAQLQLWVDSNHNGISEPSELFTLPQKGITRLSLDYHETKWVDAYGNAFRYRGKVVREDRHGLGRNHWAYDVYLHAAQ